MGGDYQCLPSPPPPPPPQPQPASVSSRPNGDVEDVTRPAKRARRDEPDATGSAARQASARVTRSRSKVMEGVPQTMNGGTMRLTRSRTRMAPGNVGTAVAPAVTRTQKAAARRTGRSRLS
ncbi:hypothetical protein C8Q80DRAFT_1201471 [Daedaleopsis nitida]|nr:hypothetical protein C8Q80DRAFT_1201471 [Daedaleopsis nitida]